LLFFSVCVIATISTAVNRYCIIFATINRLLACNDYVVVVALDFSKAFDDVRHSTLLAKMAQLNLPDIVFNWLVDYLRGHEHCTRYNGAMLAMFPITASIVQDSAVGPALYVVNAADLTTVSSTNHLVNTRTTLIIPASNIGTRADELDHIELWSAVNNLKLNRRKSTEIVFVDSRRIRSVALPSPLSRVSRVSSMKMLGITVTETLSMAEHVKALIHNCASPLYALRVLRSLGLNDAALQTVYRAVVVTRLTYAISAWWGFIIIIIITKNLYSALSHSP